MDHDWVKSTLGYGDQMCLRCKITDREAALLGDLVRCIPSPATAGEEQTVVCSHGLYVGAYCPQCHGPANSPAAHASGLAAPKTKRVEDPADSLLTVTVRDDTPVAGEFDLKAVYVPVDEFATIVGALRHAEKRTEQLIGPGSLLAHLVRAKALAEKHLNYFDWQDGEWTTTRHAEHLHELIGDAEVAPPIPAPDREAVVALIHNHMRLSFTDRMTNPRGVADLADAFLALLAAPTTEAPSGWNPETLTRDQLRDLAMKHGHFIIPARAGVTITWTDTDTGEVLGRGRLTTQNVEPIRPPSGRAAPSQQVKP